MPDKKYCIMDMDGTLVDSMPYWNRLSPDYLNGRGIFGDMDDIMEQIKTMTMPEACAFLKREFSLPDTPEEISAQLREVMRGHYEKDIPLKKGVRSYLERLRAEGARLCIVTATSMPLVHLCLSRLGIESCFDFVMSCEEVGRGKDYPDAFLEAARRLGAQPSEVAVYEDAFQALQTAASAGFYTVAVFDPYSDKWEESREIADLIIEDWDKASTNMNKV